MWMLASSEGGGALTKLFNSLGISPPVIAVQVIVFLFAIWMLRRFLFGPITDFTRKRQEEIDAAAKKIEENRAEVERLSAEYRDKIAVIEKQANERLQEAIREGQTARAKIIADAEAEAAKEIEEARAAILKEKEAAKTALRAEVTRLALEASRKMTGRTYDPSQHGRIVEEVLSEESK